MSSDKKESLDIPPCPNFVFLKRGVDGNLQLEIPLEYQDRFEPVTTVVYERWLEEKSKCPEALKELEESEMDFGEEEA